MDLSTLSKAISNLKPTRLDQRAAVAQEEEDFYATYCRRQNFALPDSIMYYIAKNPPSPEGYQKLIKTCKYFFIKNPIFIYAKSLWDGKELINHVSGQLQGTVDLEDFTSKFWFTDSLRINSRKFASSSITSTLKSKIYRCDVKRLIIARQSIYYSDYIFLSSAAEDIYFNNVTVKDENDSIISLEKLIEGATNVMSFLFLSNTTQLTNITATTVKKLFVLPNLTKIKYFGLNNILETFDIDAFYAYMKKNSFTPFDLHFNISISDAFKNRLDAVIEEILATENVDSIFYKH